MREFYEARLFLIDPCTGGVIQQMLPAWADGYDLFTPGGFAAITEDLRQEYGDRFVRFDITRKP